MVRTDISKADFQPRDAAGLEAKIASGDRHGRSLASPTGMGRGHGNAHCMFRIRRGAPAVFYGLAAITVWNARIDYVAGHLDRLRGAA